MDNFFEDSTKITDPVRDYEEDNCACSYYTRKSCRICSKDDENEMKYMERGSKVIKENEKSYMQQVYEKYLKGKILRDFLKKEKLR